MVYSCHPEHILLAFKTMSEFFSTLKRSVRPNCIRVKKYSWPQNLPYYISHNIKIRTFFDKFIRRTNDKHFQNEFKPRENVAREWGESRCYSGDDKRNNNCVTYLRVCTWRVYFLFFFFFLFFSLRKNGCVKPVKPSINTESFLHVPGIKSSIRMANVISWLFIIISLRWAYEHLMVFFTRI